MFLNATNKNIYKFLYFIWFRLTSLVRFVIIYIFFNLHKTTHIYDLFCVSFNIFGFSGGIFIKIVKIFDIKLFITFSLTLCFSYLQDLDHFPFIIHDRICGFPGFFFFIHEKYWCSFVTFISVFKVTLPFLIVSTLVSFLLFLNHFFLCNYLDLNSTFFLIFL